MSESIICERSFEFTCRIVKLCERMWDRGPGARAVARQLLDSGPSIGAHAEAAPEGPPKPDYCAKMAISRKESRETRYWLRVAIACGIVTANEAEWELREVNELRSMIIAAIKTAQSSSNRGGA